MDKDLAARLAKALAMTCVRNTFLEDLYDRLARSGATIPTWSATSRELQGAAPAPKLAGTAGRG
jgi:hypothetical protein